MQQIRLTQYVKTKNYFRLKYEYVHLLNIFYVYQYYICISISLKRKYIQEIEGRKEKSVRKDIKKKTLLRDNLIHVLFCIMC